MLNASRFVVALSIALIFANAEPKVLFAVMHDYLCLACLRFAVLCLENIVIVILLLNRNPVKFKLTFINVRYLILNHYLQYCLSYLVYHLILNSVNLLRFLKPSFLYLTLSHLNILYSFFRKNLSFLLNL